MKKALKMLLVSALVATMFSSVALAEVNIGAWGRGLFVPATGPVGEDGDIVPVDSASWYNGDSRVGFTLSGTSDNVGVKADLYFDGKSPAGGDNVYIWASPMEGLKIYAGPAIFEDSLRGNSAYGSWNWWRPSGITGEDNIFDRANAGSSGNDSQGPTGNAGAVIAYHANGIHVNIAFDIQESGQEIIAAQDATDPDGVPGSGDETDAVAQVVETQTTALMFQRGQYQVGYDIAGVGQVRAQYIGMYYVNTSDTDAATNYGLINAAVKIDQIMPALYADLGFWMATDSDQADGAKVSAAGSGRGTTVGQGTGISAYVKFAMAPMTIHASTDVDMGIQDAAGEDITSIKAGVGLDMDLGGGLGLVTDVRYGSNDCTINEEDGSGVKETAAAISFLVGAEQGYSNGKIGIGFQGTTGTFAGKPAPETGKEDTLEWAVPVKLEYWF
jgi:hypothetical protein